MSRSCRRAARLACLTSSCGLGPRSARNRSLALSRAVLAAFRAQVFKAFHRKMRTLLSDGNGQQLHVVGAVVPNFGEARPSLIDLYVVGHVWASC